MIDIIISSIEQVHLVHGPVVVPPNVKHQVTPETFYRYNSTISSVSGRFLGFVTHTLAGGPAEVQQTVCVSHFILIVNISSLFIV